jgi:hypothetical protein
MAEVICFPLEHDRIIDINKNKVSRLKSLIIEEIDEVGKCINKQSK